MVYCGTRVSEEPAFVPDNSYPELWIKNDLYNLTYDDKKLLESNKT